MRGSCFKATRSCPPPYEFCMQTTRYESESEKLSESEEPQSVGFRNPKVVDSVPVVV